MYINLNTSHQLKKNNVIQKNITLKKYHDIYGRLNTQFNNNHKYYHFAFQSATVIFGNKYTIYIHKTSSLHTIRIIYDFFSQTPYTFLGSRPRIIGKIIEHIDIYIKQTYIISHFIIYQLLFYT